MALEGNLEHMPFVDLFEVFQSGMKSGVLRLISDTGRGVIFVSLGRLIDAVLICWPERFVRATGDEAVLLMLQWERADFTFRHDPVVVKRPVTIFHECAWLINEGIRRCSDQNPMQLMPQREHEVGASVPLPSPARSHVMLPERVRWSSESCAEQLRLDLEPADTIAASPVRFSPTERHGYADEQNHAWQRVHRSPVHPARISTPATRSRLIQAIKRRVRDL